MPLTALAFFGGAIALGFGSQNVINNFISGSILLIERPIRIGDLVTINREQGVIGVGLAYGSDTGKVRTLLEGVMNGHAMVPESSENTILFVNFGDSSLDFEIHFRIHSKSVLEAKSFESNIRFMIDEEFRKNGIEIPFPQRDVHMKSGMS